MSRESALAQPATAVEPAIPEKKIRKKREPKPTAPDSLLIPLPDLPALLGGLSAPTIKRMARDNELPGLVRVRRRVMVSRAALMDWIKKGCPPVMTPTAVKRTGAR